MDAELSPFTECAEDSLLLRFDRAETQAEPAVFVGLVAATRRAMQAGSTLSRMLRPHCCALIEIENLAGCDDQAGALAGRLVGWILDAENGGDLHALIRLRRGLRLADAYLGLRRQGEVELVERRRRGDADLRARFGTGWVDIHLRPRSEAKPANTAVVLGIDSPSRSRLQVLHRAA
jgi:hypothetical protein